MKGKKIIVQIDLTSFELSVNYMVCDCFLLLPVRARIKLSLCQKRSIIF